MRVTRAFSRLLSLPGVWVRKVIFEPGRVVVTVVLRRRRLQCPKCSYLTWHRENKQHHDSIWRHLDLGVWRLRSTPGCGGCAAPSTASRRGRPVRPRWRPLHPRLREPRRLAGDEDRQDRDLPADPDRLGHDRPDHQARRRRADRHRSSHRSVRDLDRRGRVAQRPSVLHALGDHRRGCVVWGTEGKGQAAADEFFDELTRRPRTRLRTPGSRRRSRSRRSWSRSAPARPSRPATHPRPWLQDGSELEPAIFARASRLTAVSMDMTGGYAKSVREHAPQATIVIDNYHVVAFATKALDEVRREHWNELRHAGRPRAKQFKADRWRSCATPDLTDRQATILAAIHAGGGKLARAWR